jgi:hypothetical protein
MFYTLLSSIYMAKNHSFSHMIKSSLISQITMTQTNNQNTPGKNGVEFSGVMSISPESPSQESSR